jgi:hypothetical protein
MISKHNIKYGLRLVIESNVNPVTLIMNITKPQLLRVLDVIIPDEEKPE